MPFERSFVSICLVLGASLSYLCSPVSAAEEDEILQELFKISIERLINISIASKTEQSIQEAPAIVFVVTREEIQKRGWRTLLQVLDQVPGFMIRKQEASAYSLVVRGMRAVAGALIMIDGIALNDPLDGNFAFYDFPVGAIEKIEIIRGPGSALYGGNAMLSVINIITHLPDSREITQAQVAVGQHDYLGGALTISKQFSHLAIKGWLEGYDSDSEAIAIKSDAVDDLISRGEALDTFGAIAGANTKRKTQSQFYTAGYHLAMTKGWAKGLSAQGLHIIKHNWPRLSRLLAIPSGNDLELRHDVNKFAVQYDQQLNDALSISAKAFYTYLYNRSSGQLTRPYERNDDEDFDGISERWPNGKQEIRSYEFEIYGLEFSNLWQFSEQLSITSGIVAQKYQLGDTKNYANVTSAINGSPLSINLGQVVNLQELDPKNNKPTFWIAQDVSRELLAGYLQTLWQTSEDISVVAGIRYDNFDDFGHSTSPRIAMTWQWSDRIHLKAMYGEAFNPPSFISLYDQTVTDQNESRQFGNPNLKRAQIRTSELLLGYQPDEHWTITGSAFYARTKDEVIFDTDSKQFKNEGKRSTRGVEVEARGAWQDYDLWSHYTYHQPKDGSGTGAPLYPEHQFNLGISAKVTDAFSVAANYTFRSKMKREPLDNREPISDNHRVQLSGHYQLSQSLRLTLAIDNLFDSERYSPVDITQAQALPHDIPLEGRQAVLSVTARF